MLPIPAVHRPPYLRPVVDGEGDGVHGQRMAADEIPGKVNPLQVVQASVQIGNLKTRWGPSDSNDGFKNLIYTLIICTVLSGAEERTS